MLNLITGAVLFGTVLGGFDDPHFATGRYGLVHLFEWHWDTIADECETFLAPHNVGGVQISPPTENRIIADRPWWERYQPISYMLDTRSGNRDAFINMVQRCNNVGVRIYADIVINHMCGSGGTGTGTGGTYFDADTKSFPGVPYSSTDFNDLNCITGSGNIESYADPNQVRNCKLLGLVDLNQGTDYVRGKIIDFMNDLMSLGVAGFRVDATKHMWPGDLQIIYDNVNQLNSDVFGPGAYPYIYQEVIDQGGEPITASDYSGIAPVTEFKYGKDLAANKNKLTYLSNVGPAWGMLPSDQALVFINNHDNQRGHGGGGDIVTFENPYDLKILTAYMLAYPYGIPRVMSSYYFDIADQGPPASQPSITEHGACGNGWVCEHRWVQIASMFEFSSVVQGTGMNDWFSSGTMNFAFSRGNKGFIAANKEGIMDEWIYTSMPDGSYCNIIHGHFHDGHCDGTCHVVEQGYINVVINADPNEDQVFAIHVDAPCDH